jgi:drug/metabolite transporter (DMT)-like permease
MNGYGYLLLMLVIVTAGQIFTKLASVNIKQLSIKSLLFNQYLYLAFITIALGPFLINLALDHFELSFVFVFTGLYYITVPLTSSLILKEIITQKMVLGMLLIASGVAAFNL